MKYYKMNFVNKSPVKYGETLIMPKIVVTNQAEFNAVADAFVGEVVIDADPKTKLIITRDLPNATVKIVKNTHVDYVSGSGRVDYVSGSGRVGSVSGSGSVGSVSGSGSVDYVYDSGRVGSVSGSGRVGSVSGSGSVDYVYDSGRVGSVSGSGSVGSVYGSGSVGSVSGSGRVGSVSGSGSVDYVYGSGSVGSVSGSGRVGSVYGSGSVGSVSGSGSVGSVYGNGNVSILSSKAQIDTALHQAVVILLDCKIDIPECESTVAIIHRTSEYVVSSSDFCKIFADNMQPDGRIMLHKSVQDDDTDFHTGQIKYEGIVTCPDWDPNPERQCGGGLHLSPMPEMALSYNKGKLKKCLVHPDDIVVHSKDLTKVRCRQVEVLPNEDDNTSVTTGEAE